MDFSKLQVFSMMQQRMQYTSERQTVLARNIANANTPGYIPEDLKPLDFNAMMTTSMSRLPMAGSSSNHLSGAKIDVQRFKPVKDLTAPEVTPDGNAVVLEEQMLKVQLNSSDHQTTTTIYRKMTQMMNTALGNRQ